MTQRIVPLSSIVANQIAAGEVIERPASVVKELLENAMDAGATRIDIEVGYGGLNEIKISDNGTGILAEDLPLALAAHATSKIATLNDLYAIQSMGFRGEALASIASVAKIKLTSKPVSQAHAMCLTHEGKQQSIMACARAVGTTIEVSDLFYNAPVRKRFLKSERLEFQAIDAVVRRFAFSAPQIALTLVHNKKVVLTLPAATNDSLTSQRMAKIFGSQFMQNTIYLDAEHASMRLWGWISNQTYQRSQNDRQWVYINQRMVKDKLLYHAIKQSYDDRLHAGRFPSCLLYFTLNTEEVDVNVHPTKHEVRFQQPRLVHDFFVSQLTQALQTTPHVIKETTHYAAVHESSPEWAAVPKAKAPSFRRLDCIGLKQEPSIKDGSSWVLVNEMYALAWLDETAYLIDVHALYQLWLQEQQNNQDDFWAKRPLLVAVHYPAPKRIVTQFSLVQSLLHSLGLEIKLAQDELLISSIPVMLPYLNLAWFINQLAEYDVLDASTIKEKLFASQQMVMSLLDKELLVELNAFLVQEKESKIQAGIVKPLTEAWCRKVWNV